MMSSQAADVSTNPDASTHEVSSLWLRHCEEDTREPVSGEIVGTIPVWLSGKLIRNGPGQRRISDTYYNHLFDGLSCLHMVDIKNGTATYRSRLLESEAYKLNHRANRIVISEFGTVGVPDPCLSLFDRFKALFDPAITSKVYTDNCLVNVLQVKDELLAMTETDKVWVLDPTNLDAKESISYRSYVTLQRATAHPHVDEDGTVYNLGFQTGKGPLRYAILSLKDGRIQNCKIEASIQCRWKFNPGYMHSFGLTENYYILVESPMVFDVKKTLLPATLLKVSGANLIKYYKNETTLFRIISRKTGEELKTKFIADGFFSFHIYNCYETNGKIVIDLCATTENVIEFLHISNIEKENTNPKKNLATMAPWRFVIPVEGLDGLPIAEELLSNCSDAKISRVDILATASAVKQNNGDITLKPLVLSSKLTELPRINYKYNTKKYRYGYAVRTCDYKTNFLDFDAIVKTDFQLGEEMIFQDSEFYCSEPVFVEAPDAGTKEDCGVIISLLLHKKDYRKLCLVVIDAETMEEKGRVNFQAKDQVTSTFHGQFVGSDETLHMY